MTGYRLLKEIVGFNVGYVMWADENMGYLGQLPWGWEIPLFIILAHPDTFERITK